MRKLFFFFVLIGVMSCGEDLSPKTKNDIIGTWTPLYLQKTKDEKGNWGLWEAVKTYAMLPDYVFGKNGNFSPATECCGPGKTYEIKGNKIVFSNLPLCPNIGCLICNTWEVEWYHKDTMAIVACNGALKFARKK